MVPPSDGRGGSVRCAQAHDVARICDLARQLGYDVSAVETIEWLDRRHDDCALFVSDRDGHIAGWINVCVHDSVLEGRHAVVEGLVIEEKMRGLRLGERLLETAQQWACQHGCDTMTVRSNVTRERAHAFYARCGYAKVKTQCVFRKSL